MEKENKRFVGENAIQKLLRLLKSFEEESTPKGEARSFVDLELRTDGSGKLVFVNDFDSLGRQTVFNFQNVEALLSFLQASPCERLIMTRLSVSEE